MKHLLLAPLIALSCALASCSSPERVHQDTNEGQSSAEENTSPTSTEDPSAADLREQAKRDHPGAQEGASDRERVEYFLTYPDRVVLHRIRGGASDGLRKGETAPWAGAPKFVRAYSMNSGELSMEDAKLVCDEYFDSWQRGDTFSVAGCYIPRHGLEVWIGEESIKIEICYECSQSYIAGAFKTSIYVDGDGAVVSGVIKRLGMPPQRGEE